MLRLSLILLALLCVLSPPSAGAAQDTMPRVESPEAADLGALRARVAALETRVQALSRKVDELPVGLILVLFGGVSALWAQNTGRSPWLWFFLGFVFNVFALVAVLVKNGREAPPGPRRGDAPAG